MFGPKISRFILTTCRFHVWFCALASFNYKKYVSVGIFRNLPEMAFWPLFSQNRPVWGGGRRRGDGERRLKVVGCSVRFYIQSVLHPAPDPIHTHNFFLRSTYTCSNLLWNSQLAATCRKIFFLDSFNHSLRMMKQVRVWSHLASSVLKPCLPISVA